MGRMGCCALILGLVIWARGVLSEPGTLEAYNEADLKRGFATREYTTIVLQRSVAFEGENWPTMTIDRNLTVRGANLTSPDAPPGTARPVSLDFSGLGKSKWTIAPGCKLTFMDIEALGGNTVPGPTRLSIASSPNATIENIRVWDHWSVFQDIEPFVEETRLVPRPASLGGTQDLFAVTKTQCQEVYPWPGVCGDHGFILRKFIFDVPLVFEVVRPSGGGYVTSYQGSYVSGDKILDPACVKSRGLSQCYAEVAKESREVSELSNVSAATQYNTSAAVIAGAVVGGFVMLVAVWAFFLWWRHKKAAPSENKRPKEAAHYVHVVATEGTQFPSGLLTLVPNAPLPPGIVLTPELKQGLAIGDAVGIGSFGMCHRGLLNGRPVALKLLMKTQPETLARVQQEVQITAAVHHKNVVATYGCLLLDKESLAASGKVSLARVLGHGPKSTLVYEGTTGSTIHNSRFGSSGAGAEPTFINISPGHPLSTLTNSTDLDKAGSGLACSNSSNSTSISAAGSAAAAGPAPAAVSATARPAAEAAAVALPAAAVPAPTTRAAEAATAVPPPPAAAGRALPAGALQVPQGTAAAAADAAKGINSPSSLIACKRKGPLPPLSTSSVRSRAGSVASDTTNSAGGLSSGAGSGAGGVVCLVLEFLEGGSLLDALEAGVFADPAGIVDLVLLWPLLMDVARGMAALHAMGVCHGDLKADNCLLSKHLKKPCTCTCHTNPTPPAASRAHRLLYQVRNQAVAAAAVASGGATGSFASGKLCMPAAAGSEGLGLAPLKVVLENQELSQSLSCNSLAGGPTAGGVQAASTDSSSAESTGLPGEGVLVEMGVSRSEVADGSANETPAALRDLTLCCESCRPIAKIADFGLTRAMSPTATHVSTASHGTVTHMPPEVLMNGQLRPAADVYSFGIMVYELVTGQQAWHGYTYPQIVRMVGIEGCRPQLPAALPPLLQQMLESCWARDPKDRPTFLQLLECLTAAADTGLVARMFQAMHADLSSVIGSFEV